MHISRNKSSSYLLAMSAIAPFFAIAMNHQAVWIIGFTLALFWLLLTSQTYLGGLSLLWGVQFEPAPCDILFIWALYKYWLKGDIRWPSRMALHLLLAFVMLNLSQLLLINSWETGLYFTGISIYVISLCFFFASSIKNLDDWREARNYYLAAVVVTSLILIVLGIFGLLGGAGGLMELYVGSRVMGFFKDPNVAGPFVVTGALFAVSQLIFNQRRSISALAFMFVITIFSVILTFSRGAIVNLLSGMLVIYIIALFAHRGLRFTIFGLISVLPVLYLFNYFVMSFEQASRFMSIPAYDLSRIAVWKEGIRLFMEHPWGIGPGQFESYSQIYEKSIVGQTQRMAAHSLYVRVLAENGALGFTVLVLAYASIYHLCIKAIRISAHSGMDELSNAAWLASSFTGIVIESIFVDTLHWRHVWIIAGLIIAFHNIMGAKAMRRRYD